jgi:parallel beta-helix repeat protein
VLCRGPSVLFVGENATYQKIQDAINDSQIGDTVFVYNGTYHENLTISKSISLIGESIENTTIFCAYGSDNVINITSNSVNVRNFTINYYNGSWLKAAINLFRVQNCNISNNLIKTNYYRGIFLYESSNNIISRNYCSINWDGIVLNNSNRNIIIENYFDNSVSFGINLDYSWSNSFIRNTVKKSYYAIYIKYSNKNIFIENNFTSNYIGILSERANYNSFINNNISSSYESLSILISNGNYFENNSIYSSFYPSIEIFASNRNIMVNNSIIKCGLYINGDSLEHWCTNEINTSNTLNGRPIYYWNNRTDEFIPAGAGQITLVNCTDIMIENQSFNNTFESISLFFSSWITISNNTFDGVHIFFKNSDNNSIINNTFFNNISKGETTGLDFTSSNNNTIINNTITNNRIDKRDAIGLDFTSSSNNLIANNTIINNRYGIYFRKSNHNHIHNNNISSNSFRGVVLDSSSHNTIQNNQISYHFEHGIKLAGSSNNTIVNNMIYDNQGFGIHLDSLTKYIDDGPNIVYLSENNIIYHNNFIHNYHGFRFQALDVFNNTWDNGYPAGGNFWSNYEGKDEYHGINQDLPGGDGIGDTPYALNWDSTREDRYPLPKPMNFEIIIPKTKPSTPPFFEIYEGEGFLELTWASPNYNGGSEIIKYNIHRSSYYQKDKVFTIGGNSLKFNDTDVSSDDIYIYMISAENELGESLNSSKIFGTPKDIPEPSSGSGKNWNPISGDVRCILPLILIFLIVTFLIILMGSRKRLGKREEIKSDSKDSEKEKQDIEQKSRKT